MHSTTPAPHLHDAGDPFASVVRDVLGRGAALAAVEAQRVRALARAGHLALDIADRGSASSTASELALREVASEIAAAEHLSDRTVQRQISHAMTIADHYPVTLGAWESGAVSRAHVQAIVDAGAPLPVERRAEFDALAVATAEGMSPGLLRIRLAALAERLQPTTPTERHRAGRECRNVRVVPGDDGMSDLIATMPTVLAVGIYDRLVRQGRALMDARSAAGARPEAGGRAEADRALGAREGAERPSSAGAGASPARSAAAPNTAPAGTDADTRTADQVRADILADLLLTAAPSADPTRDDDGPGALGAIRARVQVVVPALTMLDPSREHLDPAELVGHGPIDADTARALAEATTLPWDRVITHPVSGSVLHTDTYQRTVAIDRHLRARDRHCRWPGCITPAVRCEVDHTHDWALGGRTDVGNLSHLCQRHHTQKQFTRWRVRQLAGGVLEWTSPTGRIYVDEPLPYTTGVQFVPDAGSPPPRSPRPETRSTRARPTETSRSPERSPRSGSPGPTTAPAPPEMSEQRSAPF